MKEGELAAEKALGALDVCGEYKSPDELAKYYVSKRGMSPSAKMDVFSPQGSG
jgi:hypothetical protein